LKPGELTGIRIVTLAGEEFQRLERLREILDSVVDPGTRDFNLDTFKGDTFKAESLPEFTAAAATFPMMTDRRVIVVRDFDKIHPETRKKIVASLKDLPESTFMMIEGSEVKPAVRVPKGQLLADFFKPVYDNNLPSWIKTRFAKRGYSIDNSAVALIVNNVSGSLGEIDGEIEKITSSVGDVKRITEDAVAKVVGSFRHDTIYNLANTVGKGKLKESVEILRSLMSAENSNESYYMSHLGGHVIKIARYHARIRAGVNPKAAQEEAVANPYFWKLNKMDEQVRRFGPAEIRRALKAIAAADSRFKLHSPDTGVLLELMLGAVVPFRKKSAGARGK